MENDTVNIVTAYYQSLIGTIEIKGSDDGITSLYFLDKEKESIEIPACLKECIKQLDEYFKGKRKVFNLNLDIKGTDFQKKVWNELLKIPFGKTHAYIDIAKKLGDKNALRAVGNANGKNPISIIIPCHRVIGSNGELVGYGGGLWRKKWLLEFENKDKQGELF